MSPITNCKCVKMSPNNEIRKSLAANFLFVANPIIAFATAIIKIRSTK